MSTHAVLSPSSARRWRHCPPSAKINAAAPRTSSKYSAEGTAAHELAARCLMTGEDAAVYAGTTIEADGFVFPVDPMIEHVQGYLDRTRAWVDALGGDDASLMTELALPIGHITGEEGATGTGDATIIGRLPTDDCKVLVIRDLKYGQGVPVHAQENDQGLLYGGGALRMFELAEDFSDNDKVIIEIDQPRRNSNTSWELTVGELKQRLAEVAPDAKRAREADPNDETQRVPGDWCKFCAIAATCKARADKISQLTTNSDGFTAPLTQQAKAPDVDRLGEYYSYVGMVRQWAKDVEDAVHARLLSGQPVEGWKLVAGKAGNRQWADPATAAATLKDLVPADKMFTEPVLLSPAKIEKLLPKGTRKGIMEQLTTRSEGSPTVASEDDPRPPYAATGSEGFEVGSPDDED